MTYEDFWKPLTQIYDAGEAKAVTRLVAEAHCGLTLADLLVGREMTDVDGILKRLLSGEPVQYVLGEAEFCGRWFSLGPGVLVPRPETEELCRWILQSHQHTSPHILDIGTGSGCIAITLAKEITSAEVEGWDVSHDALEVASQNVKRHEAQVTLCQQDILSMPSDATHGLWDIIVSNPPYICQREACEMKPWVLNHEPHNALFVPDDDPLLFYRHISHYAKAALRENGSLYFEANPLYVNDIKLLLYSIGFSDIQTKDDQFGKTRFISACK